MVAQSNTRYIKTTDYRHYLWVSPAEDDKILCKFNFSLSGNMKLVDAIDKYLMSESKRFIISDHTIAI